MVQVECASICMHPTRGHNYKFSAWLSTYVSSALGFFKCLIHFEKTKSNVLSDNEVFHQLTQRK